MRKVILASALALNLGACATILSGTSEEVVINTNPAGADCALNREGTTIARVNPTPGGTTISKTKHDLTIVCNKEGYQEATYLDHSGIQAHTWGNIVLGGVIGWGVDSASGSDNHYETPVNLSMVPMLATAPRAAPAVMGTATPTAPVATTACVAAQCPH